MVFVAFFVFYNDIFAQTQQRFEVKLIEAENFDDQLIDFDKFSKSKDSLSFVAAVESQVFKLWKHGFLSATLDTIYLKEMKVIAEVYIGEQFVFGDIQIDKTDKALVQAAGLKNVKWKDKFISSAFIDTYAEKILFYFENNGYPFAKVRLDSTRIEGGRAFSKLVFERNTFVPFDSINIIGTAGIRRGFIERYLNIYENESYSRLKVKNIPKRIGDLTFLELDSTPIIKFTNNFAQVQLYLKEKKASRFDFLIGILPSSSQGERRFSIIGEFTAEMYNKLGEGEYIFTNIQSRPKDKALEIRFKYPYLFNWPLGLDLRGGIFFNEEFRETITDIGILYQFEGASSLKISWNSKTSRLIEIDTVSILNKRRLPAKLDLSYTGGGLEFSQQLLDYRFNPSKGWQLRMGGTVGIKKIIRNNLIEALSREGLDFNLAYDSLKLKTFQSELNISASGYVPVFNVGTVKIGIEGGLQYNETQIYENELYRIGGNKLLRGFDEQSIRTDAYLISTLEFRLLLDRNSYLSFPFIDYGLTRIVVDDENVWDTAYSFGMGINFSTPAGIFNVSFATGSRLNNPLDFGATKIHFGYVSLF